MWRHVAQALCASEESMWDDSKVMSLQFSLDEEEEAERAPQQVVGGSFDRETKRAWQMLVDEMLQWTTRLRFLVSCLVSCLNLSFQDFIKASAAERLTLLLSSIKSTGTLRRLA